MELRGLIGNRLLLLPSVAAVIHDHAGNLLLQEKASEEGWSLPAGAIEPGETPQEAVVREVAEETGLVVSADKIVGVFGGRDFRYTYPNGHSVEYLVTLFKCQVLRKLGSLMRSSAMPRSSIANIDGSVMSSRSSSRPALKIGCKRLRRPTRGWLV
ncbi:NUDIX domain-containing protein [Rhizobium mesosinicum]|uniref:NUDIX domain-containing protein n=1 Tax=Rhizobium mesosinicum TaxID=335017 RepID=A0ABS7GWZ9_9HYPH|nr:NUDIX domain-containing protein [Rhizobium mesosinicum]MBW9054420.1 NUDIX domain-containing protein [Rhizobium mesosinicum]